MNAGKKTAAPTGTLDGNRGKGNNASWSGAATTWAGVAGWMWAILGDSARIAFTAGLQKPVHTSWRRALESQDQRPYANADELRHIFWTCPEIRNFFFGDSRGIAYLSQWAELAQKINAGLLRSVPAGGFPVRIQHNIKELAIALGIPGSKKDFQKHCFPDMTHWSAQNESTRKWTGVRSPRGTDRKAPLGMRRTPDLDYWRQVLGYRCDFGDPKITTLRQAIESLENEDEEGFWIGLRSYLIDLNELLSHDWNSTLALERADIGRQVSGERNILRKTLVAILLEWANVSLDTSPKQQPKSTTDIRPWVQDTVSRTLDRTPTPRKGRGPRIPKAPPTWLAKAVSASRWFIQPEVSIQEEVSLWSIDRIWSALMAHDSPTRRAVRTIFSRLFRMEILSNSSGQWLSGVSILSDRERIVIVFPAHQLKWLIPVRAYIESSILYEFSADSTPTLPIEIAGVTTELTDEMREFQSDSASILPFKIFGFSRNIAHLEAKRIFQKILKGFDSRHDPDGSKWYTRTRVALSSAWKDVCNQQGWKE